MNVAKPQKPCRRLIGGEEFEEEEVERPLVTAAKLCIKTYKNCADLFGSIPGSTRGRHDYTL